MDKAKAGKFGLVGFLMLVAGLILLFSSVNFGERLSMRWLLVSGGADTSTYESVMRGYMTAFIVTGGVLFAIGSAMVVFYWYRLLFFSDQEEAGAAPSVEKE